jgi:hypothetical protein
VDVFLFESGWADGTGLDAAVTGVQHDDRLRHRGRANARHSAPLAIALKVEDQARGVRELERVGAAVTGAEAEDEGAVPFGGPARQDRIVERAGVCVHGDRLGARDAELARGLHRRAGELPREGEHDPRRSAAGVGRDPYRHRIRREGDRRECGDRREGAPWEAHGRGL